MRERMDQLGQLLLTVTEKRHGEPNRDEHFNLL